VNCFFCRGTVKHQMHSLTISWDLQSAKRVIATVSRQSVRPSVHLSVTLMYREHIGWTSSKLITRVTNYLRVFAPRSHNIGNLVHGWHPKFAWNRGGLLFLTGNLQCLWNGARYDQGYYWWPIGGRIGAKINDLGWHWRAIMHPVSKYMHFQSPPRKFRCR